MDSWFKFDAEKLQHQLALKEAHMAEKDSAAQQINTEVAGFRARKEAMHKEDGDSAKSK